VVALGGVRASSRRVRISQDASLGPEGCRERSVALRSHREFTFIPEGDLVVI
jgi:hypothetical protein